MSYRSKGQFLSFPNVQSASVVFLPPLMGKVILAAQLHHLSPTEIDNFNRAFHMTGLVVPAASLGVILSKDIVIRF